MFFIQRDLLTTEFMTLFLLNEQVLHIQRKQLNQSALEFLSFEKAIEIYLVRELKKPFAL